MVNPHRLPDRICERFFVSRDVSEEISRKSHETSSQILWILIKSFKIIKNLDIFSERFLPAFVATERPLHGAQAEIRRETREAVIHTTQHLCHGKRPNESKQSPNKAQKDTKGTNLNDIRDICDVRQISSNLESQRLRKVVRFFFSLLSLSFSPFIVIHTFTLHKLMQLL